MILQIRAFDPVATGRKIKEVRKEKNVTVEKIGEYLNCSCQAVYKWQRGDCTPTIDNLLMLSDLLDVSLDELVKVKFLNF